MPSRTGRPSRVYWCRAMRDERGSTPLVIGHGLRRADRRASARSRGRDLIMVGTLSAMVVLGYDDTCT